jgi:hypothetical protein
MRMRPTWTAPLALLVALVLAASSATAGSSRPTDSGTATNEAPPPTKAALFNFDYFVKAFGKHYGSPLERATRQVYYLTSAFSAYVSGVAYMYHEQSYYEAINMFSDWSRAELEKMENKLLAADDNDDDDDDDDKHGDAAKKATRKPAGDQDRADPEAVADKLEREIKSIVDESGKLFEPSEAAATQQTKRAARRKRDTQTSARRRRPLRRITMDMLVKSNRPAAEPAEVLVKVDERLRGNNRRYDLSMAGQQQATMGLRDQQEDVTEWMLESWDDGGNNSVQAQTKADESLASVFAVAKDRLLAMMKEHNKTESTDSSDYGDEIADVEPLPDEMFVDLRQENCMFSPRHQLQCGSCYAFAGITMAEWLYCKKTGALKAFSEQYLIDCGKGNIDNMNGCDGGQPANLPAFIHNFGLEMLSLYPYVGEEQPCPYTKDTDLTRTGFIRMKLNGYLLVPVRFWEAVLKHSPIFASFRTPRDFSKYSDGVHAGHNCRKGTGHAMVVVGHGREGGEEFWLIRNSFGTGWGAGGYFKLSKEAKRNCIKMQRGIVYGTRNGRDYDVKPVANHEGPK